jgi:hypothetical protein
MPGINRLPSVDAVAGNDTVPLYSLALGLDVQTEVDTLRAYVEQNITGSLSEAEAAAVESAVSGTFADAVYDGSGRLISFTRSGIAHTITYGSGIATISNTSGAPSRVVSFDGSNRVTAIV